MKPKYKRYIKKILPFSLIWGAFGTLYALIEYGIMGDAPIYPSTNNVYDFNSAIAVIPSASFFMGILMGTVETLYLNKLFIHRPFLQKIIFKTIAYVLSIFVLLISVSILMNSLQTERPVYHPLVLESAWAFINDFVFWSIVIYSGVIVTFTLFISEVSSYLGEGVYNNFFTGKYHHPKEEKRIFMFLDMKSSTTIAEQLGHVTYFKLLNQYYRDLSNAIIETSGEVYQYAGDEIIVSWSLKKGTQNRNSVACFFKIKSIFEQRGPIYKKKYGLVPQFKAGFHCGTVTTGEIGTLKKEIFFTGDVLNTTARIQASCNAYNTDLLLSETLVDHLGLKKTPTLTAFKNKELRGRKEKINLYSIDALES